MVDTVLLKTDGEFDIIKIPYNVNLDNFNYLKKFSQTGEGNPKLLNEWHLSDEVLLIYGWDSSNQDIVNKHSVPPPIDNNLYFNDMIIVRLNENGHLANLTKTDYMNFKNILSEGFDNLEDDDKLSEDFELHNKDSNEDQLNDDYNSISETDSDTCSDESDENYHDTYENLEDELNEDNVNTLEVKTDEPDSYSGDNIEDKDKLMFEFSE